MALTSEPSVATREVIHIRYGLNYNPASIGIVYKQNESDTKTRLYKIALNSLAFQQDSEAITKQLFAEHPLQLNVKTTSFEQIKGLVEKLIMHGSDQESTEGSEPTENEREAIKELQPAKKYVATFDSLPTADNSQGGSEKSEIDKVQCESPERKSRNPLAALTINYIDSMEELFYGSKKELFMDTLNDFAE